MLVKNKMRYICWTRVKHFFLFFFFSRFESGVSLKAKHEVSLACIAHSSKQPRAIYGITQMINGLRSRPNWWGRKNSRSFIYTHVYICLSPLYIYSLVSISYFLFRLFFFAWMAESHIFARPKPYIYIFFLFFSFTRSIRKLRKKKAPLASSSDDSSSLAIYRDPVCSSRFKTSRSFRFHFYLTKKYSRYFTFVLWIQHSIISSFSIDFIRHLFFGQVFFLIFLAILLSS